MDVEDKKRILVVNDDGIGAEGIRRLAQMAKNFGEVWVVAPDAQCSAMSQRITVRGDLVIKSVDFPVEGVHAYSVSGTPADCVKVAFSYVLPEKPDVLFSGINAGYNVGLDLAYSGTVGAAMEGLMQGVPAIAFSSEGNGVYDVVDQYLISITEELLAKKLPANQIWNVNFPGCTCDKLRGIKRDRIPAQTQFYLDHYERKELEEGAFLLSAAGVPTTQGGAGSDIEAVLNDYISVGVVSNMVLQEKGAEYGNN